MLILICITMHKGSDMQIIDISSNIYVQMRELRPAGNSTRGFWPCSRDFSTRRQKTNIMASSA